MTQHNGTCGCCGNAVNAGFNTCAACGANWRKVGTPMTLMTGVLMVIVMMFGLPLSLLGFALKYWIGLIVAASTIGISYGLSKISQSVAPYRWARGAPIADMIGGSTQAVGPSR